MPDTLSVLLVDDDESNRDYLGVLLTALGFHAESVASPCREENSVCHPAGRVQRKPSPS